MLWRRFGSAHRRTTNPGVTMDQTYVLIAMWLSIAILAGGHARTRNRDPWAWFVSTLVLGPIAVFLLVVWPVREPRSTDAPVAADSR